MSARNYVNTATPQVLSAGVNTVATILTVGSTTGYPAAPFLLGLERGTPNEEVVLCTALAATTFTVTRGYDGTTGKAHSVGALVEHTVAALDYREAGVVRLTTTERNALAGVDLWAGRAIFNETTLQHEFYDGTGWAQYARKDGATFTGPLGVAQVSEAVTPLTSAATTTLNCAISMTHAVTLTQSTTLIISGAVAGKASAVTVVLTQDATGGRVVTWPTGTKWPDALAPVLGTAANAVAIVTFLSPDGGTTWYGFLAGKNMA